MWRGAHQNPAIRSNLRYESGIPDPPIAILLSSRRSFHPFAATDSDGPATGDAPLQNFRRFTYLKSLVPFTPPDALSPVML